MGEDIHSDLDLESFPSGHVAAKDGDLDDTMSMSMEEEEEDEESADDLWREDIIVDGWNKMERVNKQ